MPVLNFGSLNIDHVFRVDHIVRPGETLAGSDVEVFAGGKGANQSVALARAGALVVHAGMIGSEGKFLMDKLRLNGVDTTWVQTSDVPTGQAIIQVDKQGQNAIVLQRGANSCITRGQIDSVLTSASPGWTLLAQNEISEVAYLLERAAELGFKVCFNPAPFAPEVLNYPLESVSTLFVNEIELAALTGVDAPALAARKMAQMYPRCEVLVTLGAEGALYRCGSQEVSVTAPKVTAIDTTAAGDTFIGYYLAARERGEVVKSSLELGCRAAALCVTRPGAMDSIPTLKQVLAAD